LRSPSRSGKLPFMRRRVASGSGGKLRWSNGRGLRERYAEYSSTAPKMAAKALVGIRVARKAPINAPKVVAISRNMPIRILENPSFTYAAAAPEEVAITETSDA